MGHQKSYSQKTHTKRALVSLGARPGIARALLKFQRLKPHAADPGEDQGLNWQASRLAGWQIGRQERSWGALGVLLGRYCLLMGRFW